MKLFEKFVPRTILFAVINAIIMGLFMKFSNAKMIDYNIIYGTLISCLVIGPIFELVQAKIFKRSPEMSWGWGAALFGSIVMAAIFFVVLLISGKLV